MSTQTTPADILDFWFAAEHRRLWFDSTPEFDARIRERFLALWHRGRAGELDSWATDPKGALALVILLDQWPLNMFRDDPLAYSTEAQARGIAAAAIAAGFDQGLEGAERSFLYLPFMHSEAADDQERSVALFTAAGLEDGRRWALHHQEIIRRFGRFPHRNALLGRPSTPEELAYLASPGAFHG